MNFIARLTKILAYFCIPVFFGVLGYFLIYTGLKPVWEMGSAAVSFLVSSDAPTFTAQLDSIYDPEASTANPVPIYMGSEVLPAEEVQKAGESGGVKKDDTAPAAQTEAPSEAGASATEVTSETVISSESEKETSVETETSSETEKETASEKETSTETETSSESEKETSAETEVQPVTEPAQEPYIRVADVEFPVTGTQYAHIDCERIGLDAPVYWYDTNDILANGVGQSIASFLPGFGRVITLSGHNTTYFRCLENIEEGDVIHFDTNYYPYEYTVTKVEVLDETQFRDTLIEKINAENEELVMYTCYPFYAITGRKTQRLVVFADRTKGVNVKWRNLDE